MLYKSNTGTLLSMIAILSRVKYYEIMARRKNKAIPFKYGKLN